MQYKARCVQLSPRGIHQPEPSPCCVAILLPLLIPGDRSSSAFSRMRVEQCCHLTMPTFSVSDTTTDVFVFTVFHLLSISLARHLSAWCRAGFQRKAARQPAVATLSLCSAGLPREPAAGSFKFKMCDPWPPCLRGRTDQTLKSVT